jgi:hypothetical protein
MKLSPELWGVIIGGAIGVVTTSIGLFYNWVQYRSHQRFGLRQGVYIEAVAALARGVEYLVSVARLDLDDSQLAQMLYPGTVATNKIHVVGTQATIDALTKAGETLAVNALKMGKGRITLQAVQARIVAAEAEVAQSTAYLQQLGSMIGNLPRSAATPEVLGAIPGLVAEFTGARDRVSQGQAQLDSARRERVALQKQLFMEGLKAAIEYQQELMKVNIAARCELGLPLNEQKYQSEMRKSADRMIEVTERAIREIEAAVGAEPP